MMQAASNGYDPSKVLTWILGVGGTIIGAAVIASFSLLLGMDGRMTRIETLIEANAEERRAQIIQLQQADRDMAQRVSALERGAYDRGNGR
jgi:hypothetical protein